MNDLNVLLDRAAGPAVAPVDAHADLTRGHQALALTRRRRRALGLAGVATVGVVGLGLDRIVVDNEDVAADNAKAHDQKTDHRKLTGVTLLAQPFAAGPYTFDQAPQGWEVQGSYPQGVTIAPIGFADQQPLSFVGKLVILYDGNPLGHGEKAEVDGRTLVFSQSEDYTTIATLTRPGEPEGVVRIQYPSNTGWTRETMLAFLAGVHVGAGAEQGLG